MWTCLSKLSSFVTTLLICWLTVGKITVDKDLRSSKIYNVNTPLIQMYRRYMFIRKEKNIAHCQDVSIANITNYTLHRTYTCGHVFQELSSFVTTLLICWLTVGKIVVDKFWCKTLHEYFTGQISIVVRVTYIPIL